MKRTILATVTMAVVALAIVPAGAAAAKPSVGSSGGFPSESARLSAGLSAAASTAGLDHLVDFDNRINGIAQSAAHLPNVDVAVIELDRNGHVVGAANVLYDRDSPQGFRVPIDRQTLSAQGVQFSRWRLARWDDQAQWDAGPAPEDILVDPTGAPKKYMVTYPASVLKVMVGYSILRLVDQGKLKMSSVIRYHDVAGGSCDYGPSNPTGITPPPVADGATDTLAGWFDQMVTVSDNFATCTLLQVLSDQGAIASSNVHFKSLGLNTLRMLPSRPLVGSGWSSGTMTMGALDTARLMLIVNGGSGTLWRNGKRDVTANELSPASRRYFRSVLAQQSFNEVLNPVNLCGSTDAAQGIPSTVPNRWVDPITGHVVTYDGDLPIDFGYDVRPCVAAAQVTFAHKTGLTYNAGSDTGIVRALPGQDGRWYIVAMQSDIGNRFGDADWAASDPNACEGAPFVCYPRGLGRLGKAIDDLVVARPKAVR